jgi:hypothetical protein
LKMDISDGDGNQRKSSDIGDPGKGAAGGVVTDGGGKKGPLAARAQVSPTASTAFPSILQGASVLVVDDDMMNRRIMRFKVQFMFAFRSRSRETASLVQPRTLLHRAPYTRPRCPRCC